MPDLVSRPVGRAYRVVVRTKWGRNMAIETTYSSLRSNLASVLNKVVDDQEVVIVRRRDAGDVALVPATELAGLMETAHLSRFPKNARLLLAALRRAKRGKGKPETVSKLIASLDLPSQPEAN
jgi:antitoxin YefM